MMNAEANVALDQGAGGTRPTDELATWQARCQVLKATLQGATWGLEYLVHNFISLDGLPEDMGEELTTVLTRARAVLKQLPNLTKQWVPDRDWRVLPDWETRWKCRGARGCPNRPVASLWRKYAHSRTSGLWWNYCGDHLYGRRIRDGVVEHEVFVNDSGGTP